MGGLITPTTVTVVLGEAAVVPDGRDVSGPVTVDFCTFRLARFHLSVTSVFAGLHSAQRG